MRLVCYFNDYNDNKLECPNQNYYTNAHNKNVIYFIYLIFLVNI